MIKWRFRTMLVKAFKLEPFQPFCTLIPMDSNHFLFWLMGRVWKCEAGMQFQCVDYIMCILKRFDVLHLDACTLACINTLRKVLWFKARVQSLNTKEMIKIQISPLNFYWSYIEYILKCLKRKNLGQVSNIK